MTLIKKVRYIVRMRRTNDIYLMLAFSLSMVALSITLIAQAPVIQQDLQLQIIQVRMLEEDNARRLARLEELKDAGARIAVLEDNMWEIKWLSRSVAAALVIQLFVNGIRTRKA